MGATAQALELAAALARRFEGCRLRPYLCPAGVPTIGYGSTFYADGRRVTLADPPITADQADRLLLLAVQRRYLPAVQALCPHLDDPRRQAAIIDFAYNLGAGNLRASTLRRKINAEDWPGARAELAKWVKGGGKVLPGLVKRRAAEAALV